VTDELRGDDIGGRYGRQGFCIVFPHTNPANAAIAMERVRRMLEAVIGALPIQAAFGVSALASKETLEADLLRNATEGMKEAEAAGGNRIVVRMP
jgi:diguanylate cyclase (GGDEF)-like protein